MAQIRVSVGASVDANVARMYEPFVNAARRANGTILSDQKRAAKAGADTVATEEKRKQAIIERTATMVGQFAKKQVATEKQTAVAQISEAKKVADQKEAFERRAYELTKQRAAQIVRDRKAAASQEETDRKARLREVLAEGRRMNAEHAKSAKAAGGGSGRNFITDTARYAARRLLYSAAGYAVSLPGRLAAGFGVNPQDIGSMVGNYTSRQTLAQEIANSGYIPGAEGPNGQRQSGAGIMDQASAVGRATATDPMKALEGLQKFVGITGDLAQGRALLGDMAKLSQATGSHMEVLVDAASQLSAKLGDVPDKTQTINTLMRHLAAMGKLGAVLMPDFAKELSSIAPTAKQFDGNVQANIGEMAILLQESMQHGGAKSADQAATAVRNFAATLTKHARLKQFNALGIKVMNAGGTALSSPESIITQSLLKTKGDQRVLYGQLFTDQRSQSAVRGFASIFTAAGGGDKGVAAVHAEFERLRNATMSLADVDEAAALQMNTAAGRAQEFNLKVQKLVDDAIPSLQKGMEQLGPSVLAAIPAFLELVSVFVKGAAGIATILGLKPEHEDHLSAAGAATDELHKKNQFDKTTGKRETITAAEFMNKQALANKLSEDIKQDQKSLVGEESDERRHQIMTFGAGKYLSNAIAGWVTPGGKAPDAVGDRKDKIASEQRGLSQLAEEIKQFAQPGRIQDTRIINIDELKAALKSGVSGGPVPPASGGQAPADRSHPYKGGGTFG